MQMENKGYWQYILSVTHSILGDEVENKMNSNYQHQAYLTTSGSLSPKSISKYALLFFVVQVSFELTSTTQAAEVNIQTFTDGTEKQSGDPVEGTDTVTLKLKMTCTGANLRHIGNPLSRDALIIPKIALVTGSNGTGQLIRRYYTLDLNTTSPWQGAIPSWIANVEDQPISLSSAKKDPAGNILKFSCRSDPKNQCGGPAKPVTITADRSSEAINGIIRVVLPIGPNDIEDIWNGGGVGKIGKPKLKVSFSQRLLRNRSFSQYHGHSGAIDLSMSKLKWDANGREASATVTFFGEEGYCGGWHSPLILFFDKDRPQYNAVSNFELFGGKGKIYWPEKNSKAYFLALDRNGNGIVDHKNELFGNVSGESLNGFDVLAILDANKDGVIDAKDPDFSKLILWRDSTGTGKCRKKDIKTLNEMGVTSISLNYKSMIKPIGNRAEERSESTFTFKTQNSVSSVSSTSGTPAATSPSTNEPQGESTGAIIDVWFSRPKASDLAKGLYQKH